MAFEGIIGELPEDCVSVICSLTSPQDACWMSMVSSTFRSAADSDTAWNKFLPADWEEILARAIVPSSFSSKKDLFVQLCSKSILLDGGKQSFALEKWSGLKSFTLSARELSISDSDQSNHWCWNPISESRFFEVAELKTACRVEIEGRIRSKMLSPRTNYGAYLIIRTCDQSFGLGSIPSEISIVRGENVVSSSAYLGKKLENKRLMEGLFFANRFQMMKNRVEEDGGGDERFPVERSDGWMEIEMGEFFNDGGEDEDTMIIMRLREVKGHQLKGGVIVQGIEVRPKHIKKRRNARPHTTAGVGMHGG